MSYHIYTTDAIILKQRDAGEADRIFSFFTEDFGRLEVKAQGVRYLKSKLRYSLTGFSFLRLSFVSTSGDCWRLVDADEVCAFKKIRENDFLTMCSLKILSLLERLIQGQEADGELWKKLNGFLSSLENNEMDKESLRNLTTSVALDVVAHLGYVDKNEKPADPVLTIRRALEQSQL